MIKNTHTTYNNNEGVVVKSFKIERAMIKHIKNFVKHYKFDSITICIMFIFMNEIF